MSEKMITKIIVKVIVKMIAMIITLMTMTPRTPVVPPGNDTAGVTYRRLQRHPPNF